MDAEKFEAPKGSITICPPVKAAVSVAAFAELCPAMIFWIACAARVSFASTRMSCVIFDRAEEQQDEHR